MIRLRYTSNLSPSASAIRNLPADAKVSFVPMETIHDGLGGLDIPESKTLEEVSGASYNFFEDGDVLLAKVTPCFENGKKAIASGLENGMGYATSEVFVIRPEKTQIDTDYLYFLLSSEEFRQPAISSMTGAGGLKRVSPDAILNFKIPVENITRQQEIGRYLRSEGKRIDILISEKQNSIDLLKEKRQALISHYVTKGLDPSVELKSSVSKWNSEIPNMWKEVQFRRVVRLSQGLQIAQSERLDSPADGSYEYITIKSINQGGAAIKEFVIPSNNRVVCYPNDVLMARTGATGQVVTNQYGVFHNNFFKVDYSPSILKEYLVYLLSVKELKAHLLLLAGTTTIPDLNHGDFLGTYIPLPKLEVQAEISSFLDYSIQPIDNLISETLSSINLLKERRNSLISGAVTGKIDVREMVAPKE